MTQYFLITKTSSDQFGTKLFAKIFSYFHIITLSTTLNLVPSILIFLSK